MLIWRHSCKMKWNDVCKVHCAWHRLNSKKKKKRVYFKLVIEIILVLYCLTNDYKLNSLKQHPFRKSSLAYVGSLLRVWGRNHGVSWAVFPSGDSGEGSASKRVQIVDLAAVKLRPPFPACCPVSSPWGCQHSLLHGPLQQWRISRSNPFPVSNLPEFSISDHLRPPEPDLKGSYNYVSPSWITSFP